MTEGPSPPLPSTATTPEARLGLGLRLALAWLSLASFFLVAYGLAFWLGARRYLDRIFGDPELAARALEELLDPSDGARPIGPVGLLVLTSLALATLATPLLELVAVLSRRLARRATTPRAIQIRRFVLPLLVALAGVAGLLVSLHPVLNLPQVPEGPRTMLNYAFEAAGYVVVNLLAYVGVLAAAVFLSVAGAPPTRPRPHRDPARPRFDP